MDSKALLILENGTFFEGISIGVKGIAVGELIFNTAHVGYQEALTDPSYAGQLIVFTTPHVGNIGCNADDEESARFWAAGLILKEKPTLSSYWRSRCSLQKYLEEHRVVGIAEIDTRAITRLLRVEGHLSACIVSEDCDVSKAQRAATQFHDVRNAHLLEKVTTTRSYQWIKELKSSHKKPHLVVYDFGVKRNILRLLETLKCNITVVPATEPLHNVYRLQPDGIVLSNGPGDPLAYTHAIDMVRTMIIADIPILGICLGHQLLGFALGARIIKLKFGHHGINHPIKELYTGRVFITSQNHNFTLADEELPKEITVTYRSLFDYSIQGIEHKYKPIFGIQGHPEGCPGPTELSFLFKSFLQSVSRYYHNKKMEYKKCQNTLD